MNNSIKVVRDNIDEIVTIRFNNILKGMNTYKNYILEPYIEDDPHAKENNYVEFIKECFRINRLVNKEAPLVIDFYISRLNDDQYRNLLSIINDEDKVILEYLYKNKTEFNYYYILDEKILDFFIRLCTRELFFVTFYFIGYEATIWGNYDFKFPIFYKDEDVLKVYKEISYKNKLLLL